MQTKKTICTVSSQNEFTITLKVDFSKVEAPQVINPLKEDSLASIMPAIEVQQDSGQEAPACVSFVGNDYVFPEDLKNQVNTNQSECKIFDLEQSYYKDFPKISYENGSSIINGDCIEVLKTYPDNTFTSFVCDPPYHIDSIVKRYGKKGAREPQFGRDGAFRRLAKGFMGQSWDAGDLVFRKEVWEECFRVMKPGSFLIAFAFAKNYHKTATAIEEAGFEIYDQLMWINAQKMPKSRYISKELKDKNYATALKPAYESIVLAQKPISEKTIAANFKKWGTGVLNIDACRNPYEDTKDPSTNPKYRSENGYQMPAKGVKSKGNVPFESSKNEINLKGRYPYNVAFEELPNEPWARYFYCPRANDNDKNEGLEETEFGNIHCTVKPTKLMQYLIKMVTPVSDDSIVCDPFGGSGSTAKAAIKEGFNFVLIEKEKVYFDIANKRIEFEFNKIKKAA